MFVADMVRRLADMASTQFITTTFRQELVKVADKIYGVTHKNRVSRVNVITKEDALDFIDHDQSHNEVSFSLYCENHVHERNTEVIDYCVPIIAVIWENFYEKQRRIMRKEDCILTKLC